MKAKIILVLILVAITTAGGANAGFISILGEDGQVWNLDTATGAASKAVKFPDPGGSAEEEFSPNSLGVSGGKYFYTNYNTSGPDKLYRDGSEILAITTSEPYNIANGDAYGTNFYFVDRHTGKFVTVSNIFGTPTSDAPGQQIEGYSGDRMGDIAVNGNLAYLSTNAKLAVIDITDPTKGFVEQTGQQRFVGLGFDGEALFGVLRVDDNKFDLYSIDTTTLDTSKVAEISGVSGIGHNGDVYEITDASRAVPIPAAVWLLGSGIVGLAALRRKFGRKKQM